MARALLDGTKTQTRRIVKPWNPPISISNKPMPADVEYLPDFTCYRSTCPYGQPGDRLYVRETWQHSNFPSGPYDADCAVFYRADYMDDPHGPDGEKSPEGRYRFWRPSIHMPRAASRILLEVVSVRVERLQAISYDDAVAEGIERVENNFGNGPAYCDYRMSDPCDTAEWFNSPVDSYRSLWEQINGADSWDANPWVWVVEFKRVAP